MLIRSRLSGQPPRVEIVTVQCLFCASVYAFLTLTAADIFPHDADHGEVDPAGVP